MRKLFYLVCCVTSLLCGVLVLSGCKDGENNNSSEDYYTSYSFDKVLNWPIFVDDEDDYLITGERRYHFIYEWTELKSIFEDSTGFDIEQYFEENTLKNNVVLCVARAEFCTAEIKYSDFKVKKLKLSIKEVIISGGADALWRYLDFVIIPKKLLPKGHIDMELGYYWEVDKWWERN